MKLVVVCYWYYPAQNPRAFRWGRICAGLVARGHTVDVVCGGVSGSPDMEIHDGVRIHRVGGAMSDLLRSRIHAASLPAASHTPAASSFTGFLRRRVARLARVVHDLTWKKIYWPDSTCLWFFAGARKASALLSARNNALLITVSLPFTDHVIGLRLKAKHPGVQWLADIGDPFSLMELTPTANAVLYSRLSSRADRKVFEKAGVVTVTTDAVRNAYEPLIGPLIRKMKTIPPLLSLRPETRITQARAPSDEISLLFVGTLYLTLRSPEFLLRLFERIVLCYPAVPLKLRFIGVEGGCSRLVDDLGPAAASKISFEGPQPRVSVYRAMEEATILVNIGNDSLYQLPSKLVEYVAMRKPILNIVRTKQDSSAEFLAPHPCVRNVLEQSADIGGLAADVGRWIIDSADARPVGNEAWLREFLPEAIVGQYEKTLLKISHRH